MPSTIRKALITGQGGPENVTVVTDNIFPDPGSNEVQVKVLYANLGGSDMAMREGYYPQQKPAPLVPGYAYVGRVHKNGKGSKKFQPGDLVCCLTKYDSQAELCNQPEKYIVSVPEGINYQQAVALVLDWSTAYGLAYRGAEIKPGKRVFIHGISGSVGYAIFTFAKMQGAEVFGTCSSANLQAMREAGAKPFVYTDKNWMTEMKKLGGANVVYDALGFESFDESFDILANGDNGGGHLVGYGGNLNMLKGGKTRSQLPSIGKMLAKGLVPFCPYKTSFFYIDKDQKTFLPELKQLIDMLARDLIKVPIRKEYTLEEVPQAHREWNKGPGIGSVVVKVAEDKALA